MADTPQGYALLATKLYAPPARREFVPRPRLRALLQEGQQHKLTLISAPAGFGKTTVLSDWRRQSEQPIAWLSLDEEDNDPARFLSYFIAALQTILPDFGAALLPVIQSPQPPPLPSLLTMLLNELAAVPQPFGLVLDDYHTLDTKEVDEALAFVLKHQPPQMHLLLATREDPQLPLARLRARRELTELRAADLRFTPEEAAAFLNEVMALKLNAKDIAALETRTEGWIAGLQLAALSMQGRDDLSGFIEAFAGDNRYIVDYLVEEVLQRQPPEVRSFLLQTSILERLHGPLCEAVTAQKDAATRLEDLERGNLFVVPLDQTRQWFRYHHLFADVLKAHALQEYPDQIAPLHQRASAWYAANDAPEDAIRHALTAQDFPQAASLLEEIWPQMDATFQTSRWLHWTQALPPALVHNRPILCTGIGWAYLDDGELEACDPWLQRAEAWIQRTHPAYSGENNTDADSNESHDTSTPNSLASSLDPEAMVVIDQEQYRFLPATVYTARSYQAQAHADLDGSKRYAQKALDFLPAHEYLRRGPAASLLGLTLWARGDLEAAHRTLSDAMDNFRKSGNIAFALSGTYGLADIRTAQGRLLDAIQIYEEALQVTIAHGGEHGFGTPEFYMGLADLHREQGDFQTAQAYIEKSETIGSQSALPNWRYRLQMLHAKLKESQGDFDAALQMLDEAERHHYRGPMPEAHPIAVRKALIYLRQGRIHDAQTWANTQQLSVDDPPPPYLREFETIVFARLLLHNASQQPEGFPALQSLLARLLQTTQEAQHHDSALRVLVLQALTHHAQDDIPAALSALSDALALAAPQGYVRTFLDEGPPIIALLQQLQPTSPPLEQARQRLLSLSDSQESEPTPTHQPLQSPSTPAPHTQASPSTTPPPEPLVEPLSPRELEVLELIAAGLSNQEISKRLFVALSTIKGHNRNIFGKLGVRRRTKAVARARELGLL